MNLLRDHLTDVSGKTVLVRCNYDVPVEDGKVQDTTRVEDSLETIRALLEHGCKVVLLAHLGRPDGERVAEMSLAPVRDLVESYLGETVLMQPELKPDEIRNAPSRVVMLENLRYWAGEESNDDEFTKQLAECGDVYVNEAFAVCHRAHASMVGLPSVLPAYAGLHLANEVKILTEVRSNPQKPLVVVIGGAKVETKAPLVDVFKSVADTICVGGKIAQELSDEHKNLDNVMLAELLPDGKDVTETSANMFAAKIMTAKTVIWNGTMGVFEDEAYRLGTTIIARAINATDAYTVVGGGDTEAALTILDMEDNINHISTGGGAMLDLLVDGKLVALEALESN